LPDVEFANVKLEMYALLHIKLSVDSFINDVIQFNFISGSWSIRTEKRKQVNIESRNDGMILKGHS